MADELADVTDAELGRWAQIISREQARRRTIATAAGQADQIARSYLDAVGRTDGAEWVQPTGAFDAYPKDWTVISDGKLWSSLVAANVWKPGVSGWREQTGDDTPPEWSQPTGAGDAYNKNDKVIFEGDVYTSVIDANTWSPAAYPAGWVKQ